MQDETPSSVRGNRPPWLFAGIVVALVVLVLLLPPVSLVGRLSARKGTPTPKALPASTPSASPKAAIVATSTVPPQPTQLSPATATKAAPTPTSQPPRASPMPGLSPSPTPQPTLKPTEPAAKPAPSPQATATKAPSPTPEAGGVVNAAAGLWLRSGPGAGYSTQKLLPDGRSLEVLGQAPDDGRCGGVWLQVVATEGKGWVCGAYVKLSIPLKDIPTSKDIPPTPTPAPTPTRTATPSTSPTPGAAATATLPPPPPPAPTGFGYGIQVDLSYGDPGPVLDRVAGLGFNWFKIQVPWFHHEPAKGSYQWDQLDKIVSAAQARRLNVLFSVVKAPAWARSHHEEEGPPDNNAHYADFMRALASRYKGRVQAYEIWNEQNLKREWNTGRRLSAAEYVELLKVAYNTVKSVDPAAIVVSGGPTPTGYNDGVLAIDDAAYLEQMYQAGLKNYSDAVGVHPSGYNVPPQVDLERDRSNDPTATFRGPFDGGSAFHRSWSYQSTMRRYREIMVRYGDGGKKLWATEFGWASIQNVAPNPAPGYEYARDNTEAEQAQNLVQAYNLAKGWGYVGVMFVWNLNFSVTHGPNDEMAAFSIVRPDWSARPSYAALRDMPK